MNNTKAIFVLKHIVYTLLLLFVYVLQTTPGLFAIGSVKPAPVIPVVVAVAMLEGEFVGGIYGAAAGLLCDTTTTALFGFNGLFLSFFCIVSGLLVIHLLRCNVLGCILFVLVTMLVLGSVEFLFAYGMWGHDDVWRLYVFYTLPTIFYTLVITPPVFLGIRRLYRRFALALQR